MTSRSRRAIRASFSLRFRPRKSEGAGKAGCALHPRSRVQTCTKKRTRAYRFSGEHPAFPAQWFYGLLRALPGEPGSFATITSQINSAKLDASVGRQDHTTSPSAKTTFVFVTSASTASHRNVRDDRDPPLFLGETGGVMPLICPSG